MRCRTRRLIDHHGRLVRPGGRLAVSLWSALCALGAVAAPPTACVGVIPAGGGNAFWGQVEAGALRAGAALGIEVYVRGPKDELHPEVQRQVLDLVTQRGCRAVVLAPSVAERAQDVARLKRAGIPTVYIDRDPGGADVVAVVSTDNAAAGREAGARMARRLGGRGRVLLIRVQADIQSTTQREAGFLEAARQGGLTVEDGGYIGSNVGQAKRAAAEVLARTPAPPDGIFTPNESSTVAVLSVLQARQDAGRVVHIGVDANELLMRALQRGQLDGLLVQSPENMGYLGVWLAWQASQGLALPQQTYDTGVRYIGRDDALQLPTLATPSRAVPIPR